VVLESGLGELTLLPVTGAVPSLLMPFKLNREIGNIEGALVLGDHDPLPLLITEDVNDEDAMLAWTCALLNFAATTCVEFEAPNPATEPTSVGPRQRLPLQEPLKASTTRKLPGRRQWPAYLQPTGHWERHVVLSSPATVGA
jgi:hypothetical protein